MSILPALAYAGGIAGRRCPVQVLVHMPRVDLGKTAGAFAIGGYGGRLAASRQSAFADLPKAMRGHAAVLPGGKGCMPGPSRPC